MKTIFLLPLLLISITGFSQKKAEPVRFINPAKSPKPNGYSHAAVIDLGNSYMVTMSGQVALDQQGNLVGKDDVAAQTRQVFINLKNIVEQAGGSMDNLVKLTYFILDVSQIQKVRNVRDEFINVQHPPASSLVEVSKLFRADILVEIEATAIIPKK